MGIVGPNMGLIIWDLGDNWNTEQLRTNMARIEFHDHAFGRGTQIPTEGLKDGSVTAAKLAPGAEVIDDGSVTPAKFAELPAAKVYNGSTTALANGAETSLPFDTERFDTANLHDTASNTDRLTSPQTGIYLITLSVTVATSPTASNNLVFSIYKNGTVNALARNAVAPGAFATTVSTFARLNAGDYVVARGNNTTGASVNVSTGTAASEALNDFGMVWVAP